MGPHVTPDLPEVVRRRLDVLQQLGAVVDASAANWLRDQTGAYDQAALDSIAEARRVIELTVDLALSHACAQHPAVLEMKSAWETRFTQLAEAIKNKHATMSESAQLRSKQTNAAKAYIGTEGYDSL